MKNSDWIVPVVIFLLFLMFAVYVFVVIESERHADARWCAERGYPDVMRVHSGGDFYCYRIGKYGEEQLLKVER